MVAALWEDRGTWRCSNQVAWPCGKAPSALGTSKVLVQDVAGFKSPSTTVQIESRKVSTWSTGCHLWEGDAQNISHGLRLKTQRPSQERPSHPKNPSGWGSNPIFRDDLGQTSTNLNVKIPSWKAVTCSTEHPKHSNDIILIYRWIYTVSFAATLARNDPYHFSFTSTIIQHWITESRWLVTKKARSHIQN